MIRTIHPFPARMAPELAIRELKRYRRRLVVLDPMAGSGTVLRQAVGLGHEALGFDTDPLAVLMAQVWTVPIEVDKVERLAGQILEEVRKTRISADSLPWIDGDKETSEFVSYWFGREQRTPLRKIALAIANRPYHSRSKWRPALDVLKVALSRIIVTKEQGASLARDTSHSRPHRTATKSDFNVVTAFERSVNQVCRLLREPQPVGKATVQLGDARSLTSVPNECVDVVLTSPPYLNAIDYMRGHRLSLVWLGHRIQNLRDIRSSSIGAERAPDREVDKDLFGDILESMCDPKRLPRREAAMASRHAEDSYRFMSEIARVLKPDAKAILIVGNSCLKGVFVDNSSAVAHAGSMVGLSVTNRVVRDLPSQHRYLPIPASVNSPLGRRMRTETILTFEKR